MYIGLDLETHTDERLPRPVCMALCFEDGQEALITGLPQIKDAAYALLNSPHIIVAHFGSGFDFPVLAKWGDRGTVLNALNANRLRCTMLWTQLADFAKGTNHSPNGEHHGDGQGYGLQAIAKRMWGGTVAKDESTWRKRYGELDGIPLAQWPEAARLYVMNDARLALALAKSLPDVPDVARKTRQFFWLACSSARGAYTDKVRAAEWRASLEADCAAYAPHLRAAGILRDDGTRDITAIRKRIETAGGKLRNASTKSQIEAAAMYGVAPQPGALKADREACMLSSDPLVKLYSLYVDRQDKLSKEVVTVEMGMVHTRYALVESGRTSSSKPALQNIGVHSLARKCFKARLKGLLYVVTDFGMLELCCVAQLCNVMGCGDTLGAALRAGKDVHDMLALQIDPTVDPKSIRRLAKEGQFGRLGGMGVDTLIRTAHKRKVEIDEATAKRIIAAHRRAWPEITGYTSTSYHARVKAELDRTGGVLEHYRSGRLRGGLRFTQGANTLFQGLGSEVNLDAFTVLSEEGLMPVLSVHDEYHNECETEAQVKRIGEICRAVGREWLPFAPPKAEPKIVNDWSEAK